MAFSFLFSLFLSFLLCYSSFLGFLVLSFSFRIYWDQQHHGCDRKSVCQLMFDIDLPPNAGSWWTQCGNTIHVAVGGPWTCTQALLLFQLLLSFWVFFSSVSFCGRLGFLFFMLADLLLLCHWMWNIQYPIVRSSLNCIQFDLSCKYKMLTVDCLQGCLTLWIPYRL